MLCTLFFCFLSLSDHLTTFHAGIGGLSHYTWHALLGGLHSAPRFYGLMSLFSFICLPPFHKLLIFLLKVHHTLLPNIMDTDIQNFCVQRIHLRVFLSCCCRLPLFEAFFGCARLSGCLPHPSIYASIWSICLLHPDIFCFQSLIKRLWSDPLLPMATM